MKPETVSSAVRGFAGTSSLGGFLLTSVCIIQNSDVENEAVFQGLMKSSITLDSGYSIVDQGKSNELSKGGTKDKDGNSIQSTIPRLYGGSSTTNRRVWYPRPRPIITFKEKLGNGVFKTENDWNKATRRAKAALTVGSSFRNYGGHLNFFKNKDVNKPLLKKLCNHLYSQTYLSDSLEYEDAKHWCTKIGNNRDNINKTPKSHFKSKDYDNALEVFKKKGYNYAVDSLKWMHERSPKNALYLLESSNTRKVEAIRDWCGSTLDLEFSSKTTQDYHSASEVCFV